jgi:benzylsuccinate CoA-transferase BbsE subunit
MKEVNDIKKSGGALSRIRVLDLTDEKGQYCGKLLAELGADVIKIEPPEGDKARQKSPFYQNITDKGKSLFWFAYNTNKKSITLNIEDSEGRRIFKSLVRKVNLVVESFPLGHMSRLGLGYDELQVENPCIVVTSVTPFGQTGSYSNYKANDLILNAISGFIYACGDADRPPVRITVEQSYIVAGVQAAAFSVLALRYNPITGKGQHVDVSMQECIPTSLGFDLPYWEEEGYIAQRMGVRRRRGNIYVRDLWPCKDGYFGWRLLGGELGSTTMYALVEWMDKEGMAGELKNTKWETLDVMKVTQEQLERWESIIIPFLKKHTKAEIYEMALKKAMLMAPANNIKEVLDYPQLSARDFWADVEYPELRCTITHPGGFCKMSESPLALLRRAPMIGEHNHEIYINELGLSKQDLTSLKKRGVI